MSTPTQTAAYQQGYANACKNHYWTWCYNRDIDLYATLAEQVDFYNGYHDGLADRYKIGRPVPLKLEQVTDKFSLHIYD
jgi:hypothetical protein